MPSSPISVGLDERTLNELLSGTFRLLTLLPINLIDNFSLLILLLVTNHRLLSYHFSLFYGNQTVQFPSSAKFGRTTLGVDFAIEDPDYVIRNWE